MSRILTILWALLFVITIANAQNENSILLNSRHLTIQINNKKLKIEEQNEQQTLVKDQTLFNARDYIYYSDMEPLVAFDAHTKTPKKKKGKYKKNPVKVFETKDVVRPGIFYGGLQKREFVFPSITPESIAVLKYKKALTDPHLISPFYFDNYNDTKQAIFKVTCPKEVEIIASLFNTDSLNVIYNVIETKNNKIYTWKIENINKRTFETDAPAPSYSAPHIILRIKSFQAGNESISISDSPDDLFKWYNSLIQKIPNHEHSSEMKSLIEDAKAIDNEVERVKMLYHWVQSNIKYIAFEDGMAGFIPRAAGDVFDKKYGDCKDMANLLKTLLEESGTRAFLTWIGTNAKPYSYYDVPCTVADNHMICAVKMNGAYQFLDATNSFLKYGVSPSSCQGKEALLKTGDNEYEIIKIKEMPASFNKRTDNLELKLEGSSLKGKISSDLSGYWKESLAYMKEYKEYENEELFLQSFLKLGKKSSIYSHEKEDSNNEKTNLHCDVEFKNDVINAGDKTYINLNLDHSSQKYLIEDLENRTQSIQNKFKHQYNYTCSFDLPTNFEIDYLPEGQKFDHELFQFEMSYKIEGNKIIYSKSITINYLMVSSEHFNDYKKFYKSLLKGNQEKISLKIKKP